MVPSKPALLISREAAANLPPVNKSNNAYSLGEALKRYDNLNPAVYYVSHINSPAFFNHDNEASAVMLRG